MMFRRRGIAAIILISCTWISAARAAEEQSFYANRNIDLLVSAEPGTGYDLYARLIAKYLPSHLPGLPHVTVKQMMGAGGVVATNYLANIAPKDGTVIAAVQNTVPFQSLVSPVGIQFNPAELGYLGSANSEVALVFTWMTSPTKTFDDLLQRDTIMGAVNSSISSTYSRALNRLAGTRIHMITGYQGAGQALLAVENGELEGYPAIFWSTLKVTKPEWLERKKINLLVQMALKKHPEVQEVPLIMDRITDPDAAAAMKVILAPQVSGRPFIAPPGLPHERITALQRAFDETMRDPILLAEARRQNIELNLVGGAAILDLIRSIYGMNSLVLDRARELMQ